MSQLDFTVTGFEMRFARLRNEQFNLEIVWPIKLLNDNLQIGDTVCLSSETNQNQENLNLKKLLEELIN